MDTKVLESSWEAWAKASPVSILEDKVHVQALLQEQLYREFNLHDLATFAAAFDRIMQQDVPHVSRFAYQFSNTSIEEQVTAAQLGNIIEVYFPITAKQLPINAGVEQARQLDPRAHIGKGNSAFLDEVLKSSVEHAGIAKDSIPFSDAQRAVFTLAATYGQRMHHECRTQKALLAGLLGWPGASTALDSLPGWTTVP